MLPHVSKDHRKEVPCQHNGRVTRLHAGTCMNTRALSILEGERAAGFPNLAGTHLEATLPLTQRLVDMLVSRASARRNLHGLKVTLRANNEVDVEIVKPLFGFDTRLALAFRIGRAVNLTSDARLYALVATPSLTWAAVSRLATAARLAPEGVDIGRDGVAIDLRALAARAGIDDLMALARTIELEGRPGVLVVRAVVDVAEGGITTRAGEQRLEPDSSPRVGHPGAPGRAEGGTVRDHALPGDPARFLRELHGARLQGRIVLSEDLVNAAIGAALGSPGGDGTGEPGRDANAPSSEWARTLVDGLTRARWIQKARVRFENGSAVVEIRRCRRVDPTGLLRRSSA